MTKEMLDKEEEIRYKLNPILAIEKPKRRDHE